MDCGEPPHSDCDEPTDTSLTFQDTRYDDSGSFDSDSLDSFSGADDDEEENISDDDEEEEASLEPHLTPEEDENIEEESDGLFIEGLIDGWEHVLEEIWSVDQDEFDEDDDLPSDQHTNQPDASGTDNFALPSEPLVGRPTEVGVFDSLALRLLDVSISVHPSDLHPSSSVLALVSFKNGVLLKLSVSPRFTPATRKSATHSSLSYTR